MLQEGHIVLAVIAVLRNVGSAPDDVDNDDGDDGDDKLFFLMWLADKKLRSLVSGRAITRHSHHLKRLNTVSEKQTQDL